VLLFKPLSGCSLYVTQSLDQVYPTVQMIRILFTIRGIYANTDYDYLKHLYPKSGIWNPLSASLLVMDFFGISLNSTDVDQFLRTAWTFAAPKLLQTLALVLLCLMSYVTAKWTLKMLESHFTSKTDTEIDDCLVQLFRSALFVMIFYWCLWRILHFWYLPLAKYLVAIWIVSLSLPVSRFVSQLLKIFEKKVVSKTETKLDDTVLPLVNRFVQFLFIGIGVISALTYLKWDLTAALGGAGIAGLALSFAAKDALSNLIAGVLLVLDRPFEVGDRIEIWQAPIDSSSWGDVVAIGLRATTIRTPDNLIIVIPNAVIMQRDIINYTASGEHIRLRIPIGIGYDSDTELAKQLILEVAANIEGIEADPAPVVILRSFNDSAVGLEARVWVTDARNRRNIQDQMTENIKRAFEANGIEIPFPKRDLYIRTEVTPSHTAPDI
jgi:small-conductance mechanosensitive channel